MKIAITGAHGYVGRFIATQLSQNHQVIALARKAKKVTENIPQSEWRYGDLSDKDYLSKSIQGVDLIVHCAMAYTESGQEDRHQDIQIIDTLLQSKKRIVYTSSLFGVVDGRVIVEDLLPENLYWRFAQEKRVIESGGDVIRLGFVYGGSGGYLWEMMKPDENNKVYVSGAENFTWPMIHIYDLATLFQAVVENGKAGVYHGWDGYKTYYYELYSEVAKRISAHLENEPKGHAAKIMNSSFNVTHNNALSLGWRPKQGQVQLHLDELIPHDYSVKSRENA